MPGLLSIVDGKNCWALTERAGHARPDAMQRRLRTACWDAEAVCGDVPDLVVEHLGHPDAVLSRRSQVHGDGIAATAVLGLPGFVVLAMSDYGGELEQAVQISAEDGWCPGCGVQARLHDPAVHADGGRPGCVTCRQPAGR